MCPVHVFRQEIFRFVWIFDFVPHMLCALIIYQYATFVLFLYSIDCECWFT